MQSSLRRHLINATCRQSLSYRPLSCSLKLKPTLPRHVQAQRNLNTGALQNLFDPAATAGTTIQIRNVSEDGGIELEDGLTLRSSCILIGGRVFLWKTPQGKPWNGWTKEDFEIFEVLVPKPGYMLLPPPSIRQYLHDIGVQVDIMDTKNASSTFNLLTEEGRRVAAALLPIGPSSSWT
ncbi:hypothetical protein M408DRAFT_324819, partial [Serendipita vermifera MAFF 305830]